MTAGGQDDTDDLGELAAQAALLARIETAFQGVYLGMLSIIQGVALGFLATTAVDHRDRLDAAHWLALAACLGVIMLIWQDYVLGSTVFAWVPNVLDTVIPFGLGVAEFALIALAVESIRWFLALVCLVCLMGVGAWARMWVLCRSGLPINRTSFVLFRPYIRFGIVSSARCGAAGLVLLVVSLQLADRHLWIATAASCLLVLWPLIRTAQIWNAPLRELRRPSSPDA